MISTNLQRLVDAKSDIAEAITAKGGTVNYGDGFEDFPDDIASIPSGGSEDTVLNYTTRPVSIFTTTWNAKTWEGNMPLYGKYVWTDGSSLYYSDKSNSRQLVLDKLTSTWSNKTWSGLTSFNGDDVWQYFILVVLVIQQISILTQIFMFN